MSLDIDLYMYIDTGAKELKTIYFFDANITNNLNTMAAKAGIYYHVWRPDEIGIKYAGELIIDLENGIKRMKKYPEYYKQFSSDNGWGIYDDFVPWLEDYLKACKEYPKSLISVSR